MSQVKTVISVCAVKDAATWLHVSRAMIRYLDAETFCVIVPAAEVNVFRAISPDRFDVISEDSLLAGFSLAYVADRMPSANKDHAGWYFQQLVKLLALVSLPANGDDVLLLWDADTMPLHRLTHRTETGHLVYYKGSEHHPPYFDTIRRLLGVEKSVDFSFIAQSFPIYRSWAQEFVSHIESRSGAHWIDAILQSTDLAESSGFSEFETLGAFLAQLHRDRIIVQLDPWERFGYSRNLSPEILSRSETIGREFAFVAFESWDKPARTLANPPPGVLFPRPTDIDQFLATFFERFTGDRAVIQVGANDGVIADPLRIHLSQAKNDGVTAVLFEPLRYYYDKLRALYADRPKTVLLNVACGAAVASRKFYFIDPEVASKMNGDGPPNDWAHGQGSFYRESVEYWIHQNAFRGETYQANIGLYLNSIVESEAFVLPLNRLTLPNVESLLLLDVQGAELDVLCGLDWFSPPAWVVLEQDRGRNRTITALMEAFDYEYVCGIDNVLFAQRAVASRFA
jgi:FkbM family methyltransferase